MWFELVSHTNHILQNPVAREWLVRHFEELRSVQLSEERRELLSQLLLESQEFDNFMIKKFGTVKRYGAEGAESMMGFFSECFRRASQGNLLLSSYPPLLFLLLLFLLLLLLPILLLLSSVHALYL